MHLRPSILFVTFAFALSARACPNRISTQSERDTALKQAVCVLPIGKTIDSSDLPTETRRPDWMSKLNSVLPVSLVSIPGTHDAGTALGKFGWSRCQVLTIPAQLQLGIRALDIRLRLVDDDLKIYHSEESQRLEFESVMSAFKEFLGAHKSEFLVVRIRQEAEAIRSQSRFEQAFASLVGSARFKGLIYRARSRTEIPKVGQLRGKILILDNYGKLPHTVAYPNSSMIVQDDYDISDMAKKLAEIHTCLSNAKSATDGSNWFVNYTSSCNAVVDQLRNAESVNQPFETELANENGHIGLIFMNFPGSKVIHEIVASNFK